MSHSASTDLSANADASPVLYGKALQKARKRKTMSVEDVAQAIHVKAEIIEALESSATEGLPPPAFVQGYLRAYARHVEVPADQVLRDYAAAVPHQTETELRARSRLPKEASSHSPLVKIFTRVLLLFVLFALLYSAYRYYTNKVNHLAEQEMAQIQADGDGARRLQIRQHASLTDDGELVTDKVSQAIDPALLTPQPEFESLAETLQSADDTPPQSQAQLTADTGVAEEAAQAAPEPPPLPANDEVMIYADQDSWVEITDAAGRSLYYNMLREGEEKEFRGAAPFDIFFGNAPAVTLRVNDVDIDMTKFIRSNNIARFRVSTEDDEAVFHPRPR